MSLPTANFWRLLEESRLQTPDQCRQLAADFAHVKGAQDGSNSKTLAEWLVARNILSRYQTTILLGGRSGPFMYGDYNVYDRVDKGRLAGSFRAIDRPTGHPVMLAFITGPVMQDPRLWAAAANETLVSSKIISPHVQRFFEPVDLVSFKFLVSEDLRGGAADERLASGRFSVPEACRLVRMAAVGLAQMHQAGRVHGDLRGANLWIESATPQNPGNLKLLFEPHLPPQPVNFASVDSAAKLAVMADYLAPELLQPGKVPDPLSDIYALGCTLYCLLTGSPPFSGGNVQQKMVRHASEAIRPLEQFGVPPQLGQLVAFMMAKNPVVRFQSASIVAEQLAPFVDPQVLYLQPPPCPATQATYENWIAQKQSQLASQTAASRLIAPPPAMPGLNLNLDAGQTVRTKPAGPVIRTGESSGKKDPITSATHDQARQKRQMRQLVIGLVGAGILAISAVIGLNMMGETPNKPVAEGTQEESPDETTSNPEGTENPDSSTSTKLTNTSASGKTRTPSVTPEKGAKEKHEAGSSTTSGSQIAVGEGGLTQEVIPDDGNTLWASPTSGKPVSFRCVPPEGQLFLIARPSDILASAEGAKVLAALGPNFPAARDRFEAAAGVKLDEIEQLIIGLHNNNGNFPRTSFVVRTKQSISKEDLLAKWENPAPQKEGNGTYYLGKEWAYYISDSTEGERRFLMGDPTDVKDVARSAGAAPALFRDIERLRRSTDDERHFTVLFNPSFFFNDDGAPLFAAERAKAKEPLSWFLGDGLQGGLASLHFAESFYLEMRLLRSLDKPKFDLAKEFRERLKQIPPKLEDYFVALTPPPYWKKLSFRYPRMISMLQENVRVGVENDQAVINCYLEGAAAHNLVLGGELLLVSAPGTAVAVDTGPTTAAPAVKTIEEALALKTSFSFDSQSLEFAMRDLAEDVKTNLLKGSTVDFTIKIIGDDLKLDGITRNQSIRDFKQEGKTVAEVLTALVRKANPVTTVKDPSEPDQKLLWVVGPDPDDAKKQIILITTRQMADKKMYTLPDVFKLKK